MSWWFVLISDLTEVFGDVEKMVGMFWADVLGRGPAGVPCVDPVPDQPGGRCRGVAASGDAQEFRGDRRAPHAAAFPNPPPVVERGVHGIVAVVGEVMVVANGAVSSARAEIMRGGVISGAVGVACERTIGWIKHDVKPTESEAGGRRSLLEACPS